MFVEKDRIALEFEIKKDVPQYNTEIIKEFTKGAILNIYYSLVNNDLKNIKLRVSKELLDKMSNNKEKYRISKDFDNVVIQQIGLLNYEKKDSEIYIYVYANICFYDNVSNNEEGGNGNDKYWDDRWIIKYEAISNKDNNCRNCGSEMIYNKDTNMYECEFCRSSFYRDSKDWKLVDIEVEL